MIRTIVVVVSWSACHDQQVFPQDGGEYSVSVWSLAVISHFETSTIEFCLRGKDLLEWGKDGVVSEGREAPHC